MHMPTQQKPQQTPTQQQPLDRRTSEQKLARIYKLERAPRPAVEVVRLKLPQPAAAQETHVRTAQPAVP